MKRVNECVQRVKNDEFVKEVFSVLSKLRLIPNTVFLWANLERCFTLDISGIARSCFF
jgi:hypothetical protein